MGAAKHSAGVIEVRIVDDRRMRALKREHFGVNEAADVLSFPAAPPLPGEPEPPLGELVLNREAVTRQASVRTAAGWLDEATSLLVHGVAHLLGHDHGTRPQARRMLACERRGCRAVGLVCMRPYA